jgi:hypothetical protein
MQAGAMPDPYTPTCKLGWVDVLWWLGLTDNLCVCACLCTSVCLRVSVHICVWAGAWW